MRRLCIVTPTFNAGNVLSHCHASVADQGPGVTHIVQDGNSAEKQGLLSLAGKNVEIHMEEDCGMYDALNKAVAWGQGDILGHLNADEQYLPGILERVAGIFDLHPRVDIVCGDMVLTDASWRPLSYRRSVLPPISSAGMIPLSVPTCAMFFRRRVFDCGLRYPEKLRAIGDAVLVGEIMKAGYFWYFDRVPYAAFSLHETNLSNSGAAEADRQLLGIGRLPLKEIWFRLHVWIRKMTSGAYRRRQVEIQVFTRESMNVRVAKSGLVGWGWPKAEADALPESD